MNIYKWLNLEKSRYFIIEIKNDDPRNIALAHQWGGCNSNRGGKKNILVKTEEELKIYLLKMIKRRKSRGYELVTPTIN